MRGSKSSPITSLKSSISMSCASSKVVRGVTTDESLDATSEIFSTVCPSEFVTVTESSAVATILYVSPLNPDICSALKVNAPSAPEIVLSSLVSKTPLNSPFTSARSRKTRAPVNGLFTTAPLKAEACGVVTLDPPPPPPPPHAANVKSPKGVVARTTILRSSFVISFSLSIKWAQVSAISHFEIVTFVRRLTSLFDNHLIIIMLEIVNQEQKTVNFYKKFIKI